MCSSDLAACCTTRGITALTTVGVSRQPRPEYAAALTAAEPPSAAVGVSPLELGRRPKGTAGVIAEHLEAFLETVKRHADGSPLPRFVEQEFRDFLTVARLRTPAMHRLRGGAARAVFLQGPRRASGSSTTADPVRFDRRRPEVGSISRRV